MIADNDQLPHPAELINDAIMSEQPFLIVEGITDIKTYRSLTSKATKQFNIHPVELVRGYGEGCSEVIRLFSEMESTQTLAANISGNIIGIIDRDVRQYRGELPNTQNIIILKYYSIESHFIFSNSIVPCLKISNPNVSPESMPALRDIIFSKFTESVHTLRLASLDALKGALDASYQSSFNYSDGFGRLNDPSLVTILNEKSDELNNFSHEMGFNHNVESLKVFIKGKVLLEALASAIASNLSSLQNFCGQQPVATCKFCAAGDSRKCELRVSTKLNTKALKAIIINEFPEEEMAYLVELLNQKTHAV